MKAVVVFGFGILLVVFLFKTIFASGDAGRITAPPPGHYTDAVMAAALVEGVAKHFPEARAQIAKSATGEADLSVKNHVAFVATLDPSHADSLCSTIAGMYDPDSGWALPLTGAIVTSGGKSVAICSRDGAQPLLPGGTAGPH
jgi:hypothetical protein